MVESSRMTLSAYTFEVVEGQEWIFPTDDSYFETFNTFDGKFVSDWVPPIMEIDREEKTYSDFPWLAGSPV